MADRQARAGVDSGWLLAFTEKLSMPVVCGACGSENRENAKFCIGCASRLPGFVATGPSALETINHAHPRAPVRSARVWRRDDPLALLPAETAGFWLRLALLGLAMGMAFIGW
jgi:hypothetical protein